MKLLGCSQFCANMHIKLVIFYCMKHTIRPFIQLTKSQNQIIFCHHYLIIDLTSF